MRPLVDVVAGLAPRRNGGVIYAATPWSSSSPATVHDPRSVMGPPDGLEAFLDAELAFDYARAWSSWHPSAARPGSTTAALIAFALRTAGPSTSPSTSPPAEVRASTSSGGVCRTPDEDLTRTLLSQVASGDELFVLFERLDDPTGQTYVEVARFAGGRLLVEQRSGPEMTHRSGTTTRLEQLAEDINRWSRCLRPPDLPNLVRVARNHSRR